MGKLIPFYVPYVPEASKKYVLEALENNHQQGDGQFTAKASRMISELVGGGHVLLTPSCTHALEMASMLANIGPGDEVILPSYTFTSAATAVTKFGATPVFVDIEMESKGIDVNQVGEAITPKTKAISWVNYAGVAPDIEGLQSLAKEFGLLLIEDNAHGLGGTYRGKPLGSFGDFATQSFHATKNIQCGEGGALIINNKEYLERAEIIREKGTDRSKFIRGEVQKYQWIDHGSSYLLAEALAAVLLGQFEMFETIQSCRTSLFDRYLKGLQESRFATQFIRKHDEHTSHMFYLVLKSSEERESLQQHLSAHEIQSTFHYQSLAHSKKGLEYSQGKCKASNSVEISNHLLRLPLFFELSQEREEKVINSVLTF